MRKAVARYGACLQHLPSRQRRVLRMRAGIGPRAPLSRTAVARRLDITVTRVRRLEHRALRALRRGCGDGAALPAPDGASASMTAGSGSAVLVDEPPAGAAEPGAGDGGAASGANGADGTGGDGKGGRGGVKGTSATAPLPAPVPGRDDPLLLIIAALLVGGVGWYGWYAFTRPRERYDDY